MDPVPASPVQSQVYLQEKGRGAAGKCLQTQGRESNKNGWIRILKIAWSYYMCVLRRFEGNASGTGNNGPSHLLWHWIQLPECPQPTAITRSRRIKCWGVANEIQPPNINLIFEIKSHMILEDRLIQIICWGGVPKGFCNTLSTTANQDWKGGYIMYIYIYIRWSKKYWQRSSLCTRSNLKHTTWLLSLAWVASCSRAAAIAQLLASVHMKHWCKCYS